LFGILKTTSNVTKFNLHELLDTMVSELFSDLKTNNLLSQIKDWSLSMCILVYKPALVQYLQLFFGDDLSLVLQESDDEDDVKPKMPLPWTKKHKLTNIMQQKIAYCPQLLVLQSTSPPFQYDNHIF
jgi:hypothetical protein